MRRKKIQKTKGMSTKVGEERTLGTVLPAGDLTVGGDGSTLSVIRQKMGSSSNLI